VPTYSVTHTSLSRKVTDWVEAASKDEALAKTDYVFTTTSKMTVRQLKDRSEWRDIWWKALNNMPSRIVYKPIERWVAVSPNKTPIGNFIKKQAKGDMKQVNGVIFKRIITRNSVRPRQLAILSNLLGYANIRILEKGQYPHRLPPFASVTNGLAFGTKPKGERAELLKKLAGPDGAKLAIELLNK